MTVAPLRHGGWVEEQLGVRLTERRARWRGVHELVGLAVRRNPRRAHLLVSGVLGKHVPADPAVVLEAGRRLGAQVRSVVGDGRVAVLGFAETATGLGHAVAAELVAPYLHSTRRHVPTAPSLADFDESHSHATAHRLLPDAAFAWSGDVLVLVDDELSTGATARATITAVHAVRPFRRYVLAALLDVRGDAEREDLARFAADLGAAVDAVALVEGGVELPPDLPARAAELAALPGAAPATPSSAPPDVRDVGPLWPHGVRESGRHGFTPADDRAARAAAGNVAAGLVGGLRGRRVLVVGTEELMYVPTLIAAELATLGVYTRVASTTRSPVVVLDEPGYAVRHGLTFPSAERAAPGPRHLYNVAPGQWDAALVVADDAADPALLRAGLLGALATAVPEIHLLTVPCVAPLPPPLRGPDFGSYPADDVGWLLTDLSAVRLEAPVEEREEAIQSGGAHYAESLPVEYRPDADYHRLYRQALELSAERVAEAVGVVTEQVLRERGPDAVLVSLARAGTPVGVLMRRWAQEFHGLDLPHYAVSIVRGRGIDRVALQWLAAHHRPEQVMFVDGWTGKGAIVRELAAALDAVADGHGPRFDPALAVLADPGSCVRTFGTRDDFLIPSACLNSTVSGLVSRTVLNREVLAPGQFHGAKFYAELAADDVSVGFVDAISAHFADVAGRVQERLARPADTGPTWSGWAAVERISTHYGIGDVTLVKPGIGETTRVLLRRVPWAVLVRPDSGPELDHVRLLAERRGVPVREIDGSLAAMPYRCVGLIHPRFTRAATGADGRSARP